MGSVCVRQNSITISDQDHQLHKTKPQPSAINEIMGEAVNRENVFYLYALFCATRLADKYRKLMYPKSQSNLEHFHENTDEYLAVINELYRNMCFEERTLRNFHVDAKLDLKTKESLCELAYYYWKLSSLRRESTGDKTAQPVIEDISKVTAEQASNHRCSSDNTADFQNCYEDTLKMLAADMERKHLWNMKTVKENKEFADYLKMKERDTYQKLYAGSGVAIKNSTEVGRKKTITSISDL